jgi:hypothetical protein
MNAIQSLRISFVMLIAILVFGCAARLPSVRQPNRLYTEDQELTTIRSFEDLMDNKTDIWNRYFGLPNADAQKTFRNEIIAARMYAIDVEYTKYESQLTHENQDLNFASTAAATALTTAAALIPVAHTSRALSGVAAGVIGLDTAYNEKVLLSKTIQNVQTQMRANRSKQAAIIVAAMSCTTDNYPFGTAMSDIEAYYRAGTFTAGLVELSNTVGQAATIAQANKDAQSPGSTGAANSNITTLITNLQNAQKAVAALQNKSPC